MLLNRIPTVLIDHAVYLGNSRLMGTGQVSLPNINAITPEIKGAGIGGSVEIPVLGHTESMTLGIAFRTVETAAAELLKPIAQDITIRASQMVYDGSTGATSTEGVVYYARVINKSNEGGSLDPGNPIEANVELEVLRLRAVKAGVELYEIDKLNGIYRVLGVDYSAGVRTDLGI